ncbi:hypothetical protein OTU49_007839 [Cherax quadricarinatus]|uniref:Derlin n=1 Tax=Cherax quadricarinatus TaxID=27406 RepID=A0AAW0WXZ9_CHEQU
MAHLTFQQEYMQMPPVTRAYTTACVITTILVQLDIVSPFQLYFNPILIFRHYQVFGGACMLVCAMFCSVLFLGPAFTIMLVYVWARRNPFVRMNFFGLLNFQAPYLPWVLLGFSVLLGNSILVDLVGIAVGHIYYFLEDVFPARSGGIRLLKTPRFLVQLCEPRNEDPNYNPLPEERPGGFLWGERPQEEQQPQQQQ